MSILGVNSITSHCMELAFNTVIALTIFYHKNSPNLNRAFIGRAEKWLESLGKLNYTEHEAYISRCLRLIVRPIL